MVETLIIVNSFEKRDALRLSVEKKTTVVKMGEPLSGKRFHRVFLLDPLKADTEDRQARLDYWWDLIKTVRLYPRPYVYAKDISSPPEEENYWEIHDNTERALAERPPEKYYKKYQDLDETDNYVFS